MSAADDLYTLLTRDGMGARQAARRLKLPWAVAQRAIRTLLLDERIRRVGGKAAPRGAMQFWEPGLRANEKWPKVAQWSVGRPANAGHHASKTSHAPTRGGLGQSATLPVRLHRGRVSVPIRQAPEDLAALPGCYTSRELNGAKNHWYEHRDEAGERWTFQVSEPKNRARGMVVQVSPPAVTTSDPILVSTAGEPNGWWKKRARKEAHRWSDVVGIELYPDPDEARVTQPIEGGVLVDKDVPKIGQPGVDASWVDGSPRGKREVESADLEKVRAWMQMPGDLAEMRRQLGEVVGRLDEQAPVLGELVGAVKRLTKLYEGQLAFNAEVVKVQAAQVPPPAPREGYA